MWLRALAGGRRDGGGGRPAGGTVADPALLVGAEAGADAGAAGRALAAGVRDRPGGAGRAGRGRPGGQDRGPLPRGRPVLRPDLLTAVVRSISAQQITLRFAAVLRGRLARRYGHRHRVPVRRPPARPPRWSLDADRLAGAEVADLRELQFSTSKAVAVAFAGAVAAGGSTSGPWPLEDEAVVERLVAFPGIGRWTAEWLLARTLGRPRVVAGDLGVRKAVGPPTWTAACRRRPRSGGHRPLGRGGRGRPAAAAALAVGRGYWLEERDPARAVVTPRLIRTPPETSRDALATPGRRRSQPAPVEASTA